MKIPVYCIPGLAANTRIFEYLQLDPLKFTIHFLPWIPPCNARESLKQYARRMTRAITHHNPVLLGVSFGGIVAQEIADIITVRKVILISSACCFKQYSFRLRLLSICRVYTFFPVFKWFSIASILRFCFASSYKKHQQKYQRYLTHTDKKQLHWAVKQVLQWRFTATKASTYQIHGLKDTIFSIKEIPRNKGIVISGAAHALIITHYKWLNIHLPKIIIDK